VEFYSDKYEKYLVINGLLTKLHKNPSIPLNASSTEEYSEYPGQIKNKHVHFTTSYLSSLFFT
jgi:hypothetical protein